MDRKWIADRAKIRSLPLAAPISVAKKSLGDLYPKRYELPAMIIVAVKLQPLARVEPRTGVYVFGGAIRLPMIPTTHVERLLRKRR